jgi:hypothetical protein
LNSGVKKFNQRVVEGRWKEEDDLGDVTTMPIAVLDDIITVDDDDVDD